MSWIYFRGRLNIVAKQLETKDDSLCNVINTLLILLINPRKNPNYSTTKPRGMTINTNDREFIIMAPRRVTAPFSGEENSNVER